MHRVWFNNFNICIGGAQLPEPSDSAFPPGFLNAANLCVTEELTKAYKVWCKEKGFRTANFGRAGRRYIGRETRAEYRRRLFALWQGCGHLADFRRWLWENEPFDFRRDRGSER